MDSPEAVAMRELRGLGWTWTPQGPIVTVMTDNGFARVLIPLRSVWLSFNAELPQAHGIGCPQTVGGFFSSIRRAARRVSRKVNRAYKKVVPRKIRLAAGRVLRKAHKAFTSKAARAVVASLGVAIPALAPAAAAIVAAQTLMGNVQVGIDIAKKVQQGVNVGRDAYKALTRAKASKDAIKRIAQEAKGGSRKAQELVGAFAKLAAA